LNNSGTCTILEKLSDIKPYDYFDNRRLCYKNWQRVSFIKQWNKEVEIYLKKSIYT